MENFGKKKLLSSRARKTSNTSELSEQSLDHGSVSSVSWISQASKASILSRPSLAPEYIKASTVKDSDRSVILWTPVVLGNRFPPQVARRKVDYKSNSALNNQQFPGAKELKSLDSARILKLPLTNVETYLQSQVAL